MWGLCYVSPIFIRDERFDEEFPIISSSRFSRNSEADASEFVENLEEMFHQYYMHGVLCIVSKSPTTQ